jgi:predicted nucleotidyltransferase
MNMEKVRNLIAEQEHVKLAYLFGSYGRKKESSLSDIDIAVFLDEKLSKSERFKLKLDLIKAISSALKTDRLDLVVMNDSPINLNYEIIKHGEILHVKDAGEKVDLESRILSKYLDRRYYERRGLDTFLEKVLERESL